MKLGFLTDCLPDLSLARIASWARETGYDSLEIAAWPPDHRGDHPHACHLDVTDRGGESIRETARILERYGLTASGIGFYGNNLHASEWERERSHAQVRWCVDAAKSLEVPYVNTFIGRDVTLSEEDNLKLAERVLPPLADYADRHGVTLTTENCPMGSWHPDGYLGNLAHSPQLWRWAAEKLGFRLNYDPSHLLVLGIDPVLALRENLGLVAHVQAKDTEIDALARARQGIHGLVRRADEPAKPGWWRYRVPGRGDLDWRRIIDVLDEGGYDGAVVVEHEDPVWSGSVERVERGLRVAYGTLRPLVG
ncbi:sugar phosphate isomerase/epimerase [Frankia sp. QA3]|uniref:sugar phosphate isomerase/epimerase family protein n=1 Tax=Frankia sp. QA3 TaxID=710111 RepID=UPI000269CF3F|nr:sugar phosphate isomerase/epimerase [Frankia sp. QA3]EIV96316.1 sugar phosphate isomerase/epimerase [Frankia sp. QA3]